MSCICDDSNGLATFSLPYYREDTAPIVASLLNADGSIYVLEAGTAIEFAVFADDSAGAARLWDKATGQGIALLDPAAGRIAITPTVAESAALVVGVTYPALLRLTDTGGALVTMGKGYLLAR